jgi:serine/threonine-protein kinase
VPLRNDGDQEKRPDRGDQRLNWSLAAGDVLAHYRVLSPLGSGGMAQVYLAEDIRLGRQLALKVLSQRAVQDEERLRRFELEARAISALNHPNILTIYDVGHVGGTQFLATEYIDGVTLRSVLARGPLDLREALDLAIQIAQAVAAAHDAGVVHRDLKPENVMVRADGYVKVLDFGLAKLTARLPLVADSDWQTQLVETKDGIVMGTFNYMAPEQARGGDLDARADLFSLGVLMYEMLAGHPPFKGASAAEVIGAVLFLEPEKIARADVPDALAAVVMTALRKDRNERYQTCATLLQDLRAQSRWLASDSNRGTAIAAPPVETSSGIAPDPAAAVRTGASAAGSARPGKRRRGRGTIASLAVLPFVNQIRDEHLDYFGDGLTESLINDLSQLPKLRVMARSTVFRYKGHDPDPQDVGRRLGVQAVLTGHVEQHGDGFVVGVELVDVEDGTQLWGARLNRRRSDLFILQAELSQELTGALRVRLTGDERRRLGKRHTVSAEAYQLYLRGRYFLNVRTGDALKQARSLFERAVAEDPAYALAYAGLADCCSLTAVSFRGSSGVSLIEQGRAAAMQALALDPTLADGHASLAFISFRFDWDWSAAEAEFARALDLNPGHAPSRQWYAMYLASRRRFDAALTEMARALELDPLSLIIRSGIGRILHFAGRLDEAIHQYEHVLQTNPGFGQAHIDLALTRMARGELELARAELARAEATLGQVSTILLLEACCDVRDGRDHQARAAFAELRARYDRGAAGADDLAMLSAVLGDWQSALVWLTEACTQRSPFLGYVDVEPAMAPLLADPRCRAVLQSHGFDAGD